ncbi:MAG: hypothetical protein EPN94_09145 [Nitrospirae bacterium]|nr:MAG: hypothetical protein EPN94_09145 [Nitrospirota bacterium]
MQLKGNRNSGGRWRKLRIFNQLYNFLSSVRLTIVLFVLILISCVTGTALLPVPVARLFIFSSIWFNVLLVFLISNVAFCFFPKIWRRKIDLIFAGMIIFHLSFILLFIGIVYDSMFYFRGTIRLTEGETLNLADSRSYDHIEQGRFFERERNLKMWIVLHKLVTGHKVNGKNMGVANEISVGGREEVKRDFIYVINHLEYKGFKFYRARDGFSPLIVLRDRNGNVLYGAYSPLQSIREENKKYLYVIGTAEAPGYIPFPQDSILQQLFYLQAKYYPSPKNSRIGEVFFDVREIVSDDPEDGKELFSGSAALRERVSVGDYFLSMEEVRYWASIDIRHNPGLPLIFTSLWIGFGGIILTTVARLIKRK